ncbi:hypothetical protein ACLKA6_010519 [Drosophila palustris]
MLTCGAHKVLKGSDSEMRVQLSTNIRSELKRTLALRPQPDDGSKDNEDDDNHEDSNEATTRQQQTVHARVPTQVSFRTAHRADNDNDNDNYRSAASGYVRGMEAEEMATTAMLSRTMRGKGEEAKRGRRRSEKRLPTCRLSFSISVATNLNDFLLTARNL